MAGNLLPLNPSLLQIGVVIAFAFPCQLLTFLLMPRIAEESIQKVADASDIVEIIGGYFPLKRAGTSFRAICPFHKEKSPSFHVNPSRQSFHCFGCGAGGGVFRFVMDYEHVDFPSAVRKLAQRAGIVLVEDNDPKEQSRRDQRSRLLELHRETAAWFHTNLLRTHEAEHARSYLKKRGLTKEIAVDWQIGYAPAGWESLRNWAMDKGFTREELITGGLLTVREGDTRGGYDRFRDRLMFPIRNDYGEVVAFSGRILNDSQKEAKYVNSPETPIFSKGRVLFGLDKSKRALIDAGSAIVLEGQIDLISAFEHGVKNVVAPQGTAFTAEQARLLRRFVEQVTLCFDSDTAGQNAVERSLPALLAAGISVKAARLPVGEDPDSLIRGKGVEAFQNRLSEARDFFDHTIDRAVAESGGNFGPREKASVARHLGAYLSLLPDAALRETTTAHVASTLGISVAALQEAAAKNPLTLPEDSSPVQEAPSAAKRPVKVSASTELICRLAIISPEVREWLTHQTSPTPAELDPELELLEELLPSLKGVSDPSPSTFLALIPQDLQSLVSGWEFEKMPASPLEAVQDALRNLQLHNLKKLQNSAAVQLRSPGLSGEKMLSIQKEILDLQQKIKHLSAPATSALTSLR
jgi:DNA primase